MLSMPASSTASAPVAGAPAPAAVARKSPVPVRAPRAVEPAAGPALDSDRAPFDLSVADEPIPYRVMAVFALPDEVVPLDVWSADTSFEVGAEIESARKLGGNRWAWTAPPQPGVYPLHVRREAGGEITVNVFVMIPYDRLKRGSLDGYRIGAYPVPPPDALADFDPPRGFVEVTSQDDTVLVSPHFHLRQFLCKERPGYPQYLVLQPALLLKLERLLDAVRRNGIRASTFQVMSGYRTPAYNRGIGNLTTFTRHQYGDAADIFVDENPADGRMDDLNHDGRIDRRDARLLRTWAEQLDRTPQAGTRIGGLSDYGATATHGPFVHVDARGYAARW